MRKSTFTFLLILFAIVTGSYLAWAALPCLRPPFIYARDVPPDARETIARWRKSTTWYATEFAAYPSSLTRPFENKVRWMDVSMDSPDAARIETGGSGSIIFTRTAAGKWEGWYHGCFGAQPVH